MIGTITNSSASPQIPTQYNNSVWAVAINGEEPIIEKGSLNEIQSYYTQYGESNININLCRRRSYQGKDLEEIWSIFDQVKSVVLHLEVSLPKIF